MLAMEVIRNGNVQILTEIVLRDIYQFWTSDRAVLMDAVEAASVFAHELKPGSPTTLPAKALSVLCMSSITVLHVKAHTSEMMALSLLKTCSRHSTMRRAR